MFLKPALRTVAGVLGVGWITAALAMLLAGGSDLRVPARLWLVAHGAGIVVGEARIGVVPLGATLLVLGFTALVAHRVARHAGTITLEWYEQVIGEGLDPLEWVEVVGIVVAVVPPVAFARAVGLPLPPLPDAVAGSPTGREAAELAPATLNWVPVAAPADQRASVVQALSALPDEWDNLWRLAGAQYMSDQQMSDPQWNRGTLTRAQMELVAGRLSLVRECFF